jgi:succinate-acetate transporter protein
MSEEPANPAPMGLMGFGMTTVLLNLHNAELLGDSSLGMILSMGIFYGGLAQIFAGMWEVRKGNTFGATAFTSYGLFWLSLVTLKIFPKLGLFPTPSANDMGAYLFMWGLFTAFMTIGTLRTNRTLQFVFASLALLFFLLSIADFTGSSMIKIFAGYEGVICGLSAIYLAIAEVLNESYGKTVLPI